MRKLTRARATLAVAAVALLWHADAGAQGPPRTRGGQFDLRPSQLSALLAQSIPVVGASDPITMKEFLDVEQKALLYNGTPDYPLGLGLVFQTRHYRYPDRLLGFKIHKGMLIVTRRVLTSDVYSVQNNSADDRDFIVDHPIRPEWALLDDNGAPRKIVSGFFRFELSAAKGKPVARELKEEMIVKDEEKPVKDMGTRVLRDYLAHPAASAAVKGALAETLRLGGKIEDTAKQLADVDKLAEELGRDQVRLRGNLQIIPQSSDHYKKFLEKFVSQEADLDAFQRQKRQLHTVLQTQQREYQVLVANLNAE